MLYLLCYVLTAAIFLVFDAVWLKTMVARVYRPVLRDHLLLRARVLPALVFYLLYIAGILLFAQVPALEGGAWAEALWRGALFGLMAYGTYGLTNYATLRNWSLGLTLTDLAWGTFVTAVASMLGCLASTALLSPG